MRYTQEDIKNVNKVVSSTGGFYNPDKSKGIIGEFYLNINGIPQGILIQYKGDVVVTRSSLLPENVFVFNGNIKKQIIILSYGFAEFTNDLLFTFTGEFKSVSLVKIFNWGGTHIFSSVVNYDQTNTPISKSKTNFEDDSIVIREPVRDSEDEFSSIPKKQKNESARMLNYMREN